MLQANLTASLPVLTAVLFIFINPDIAHALFRTTGGNIALGFAAVCEFIGLFVVRRLAVIEV
jgi:Flp pilus assembly protein TadB